VLPPTVRRNGILGAVPGVLFDVDGVLVDSLVAYRAVWSQWAARHGLDAEVVWAATHGRRPEETVADVAGHLDPLVERIGLDRLVVAAEHRFVAVPGAAGLLTGLPSDRWGVVTSGDATRTRARFTRLGLPLPDVLVGGDDVARGKPDPAGFLLGARRLAVPPAEVLAVEDSPAGLAAAHAAGMPTIGVASTHPADRLTGADVVVADLAAAAEHVQTWVIGRG